jgi:hypothetical protein
MTFFFTEFLFASFVQKHHCDLHLYVSELLNSRGRERPLEILASTRTSPSAGTTSPASIRPIQPTSSSATSLVSTQPTSLPVTAATSPTSIQESTSLTALPATSQTVDLPSTDALVLINCFVNLCIVT